MAGIRIGGMASGMDTDNMVKQMMKPYTAKVDKVKQDRQYIQWQQDAYRDVIKTFRGFYNKFMDPLSKDYIMSSKNFSSTTATSTNSSIAVTTLPGAIKGDYSINVTQSAQPAQNILGSYNSQDDLANIDGPITIKINGKETTVNTAGLKVVDVVNNINTACKDMGIKAQYSQITKQLTVETTKTGVNATFNITGTGVPSPGDIVGLNAKAEISKVGSGVAPISIESETNTFNIDNMSINVSGSATPASPITSTISVNSDVKPTVDKIKAFVEEYNKLVGTMTSKLTEKKVYSYKPLTDEQKKDMKEDDIKNWDEKCKQGIMSNDSMISGLMGELRKSLYQGVTGAGISLSEIGISTSSDYLEKSGQLVVDEDKLTAALENNSEGVMKLFTSTSDSAVPETKFNDSGIFQRMKTSIYNTTMTSSSPLLKKCGYEGSNQYNNDLTNKLKDKDTLIKKMESDLTTRENNFYSKFAALEKAMNQSNAQQSWLTQQLGGGA